MKKYIVVGLAGALVAQIWGTVSWMLLSWHCIDFRSFTSETPVVESVRQEAVQDGIYMLPNFDEEAHKDEAKMKAWHEKAAQGPFAFMVIVKDGVPPGMGKPMTIGFLFNFLIAMVLFWLVSKTSLEALKCRAGFIGVAGTIGAVYPYAAHWNWWHFPVLYCVIGVVDLFITWYIAGWAMAKLGDKCSKC